MSEINISKQSAEKQVASYFDYYSEDIADIEAFQDTVGGIGLKVVLGKVKRLIQKGIVSIEVTEKGAEIIQKLFHNKSFKELRYAPLNGEAAMAISEIGDDTMRRCTLLGKLSGTGADTIKGLVGADWKNAGTLHAFLSLF